MTFFADLSPCSYFGDEYTENLRAVGWLHYKKPYKQGKVSKAVFNRLCRLLQNPWEPGCFLGFHVCQFCRPSGFRFWKGLGGYRQFRDYGIKHIHRKIKRTSTRNLFVPGDGFIYVSPEAITHYIYAHGYRPPEEFCRAVLECPEMRSTEYHKAVLENGGRFAKEGSKEYLEALFERMNS